MDEEINKADILRKQRVQSDGQIKALYCCTITPRALRLIRRFDGDVVGNEAIICNSSYEEPSQDNQGRLVEGAFRIYFPNQEAICYNQSGAIAFVL